MIFTIILMLIVNMEWLFILWNYEVFQKLEEIRTTKIVNNQDWYMEEYLKSPPLDFLSTDWYIDTSSLYNIGYDIFRPKIINIPSLWIEAPIYTTNRNIEHYLNKWVVNVDLPQKDWYYIFWHSSSKVETPYSYIFTQIGEIKKDWVVAIEWEKTTKLYKYKDTFFKKWDKLDELPWGDDVMYLITCYPFNTSIARMVVELEFLEERSNRKTGSKNNKVLRGE